MTGHHPLNQTLPPSAASSVSPSPSKGHRLRHPPPSPALLLRSPRARPDRPRAPHAETGGEDAKTLRSRG